MTPDKLFKAMTCMSVDLVSVLAIPALKFNVACTEVISIA